MRADNMRCKGEFINDRTCDLCMLVNRGEYDECFMIDFNRRVHEAKIDLIECKCPNRKLTSKDYAQYYTCILKEYGNICVCTLECSQYL